MGITIGNDQKQRKKQSESGKPQATKALQQWKINPNDILLEIS